MIARPTALRLAVSVAVAAALAVGTTGCTLLAPTATKIQYDPADGVSVNLGDVLIRDAKVVPNADGSLVSLAFTAINDSGTATPLNVSYTTASGVEHGSVTLPTGITNFPGTAGELTVSDPADAALGSLYTVAFEAHGSDTVPAQLPVLDATGRPWLDGSVPTPLPTPVPLPSVVPSASPTP